MTHFSHQRRITAGTLGQNPRTVRVFPRRPPQNSPQRLLSALSFFNLTVGLFDSLLFFLPGSDGRWIKELDRVNWKDGREEKDVWSGTILSLRSSLYIIPFSPQIPFLKTFSRSKWIHASLRYIFIRCCLCGMKGFVYRRMKGERLPSHHIFFFCRRDKRKKYQANKMDQYMLLLDYFFPRGCVKQGRPYLFPDALRSLVSLHSPQSVSLPVRSCAANTVGSCHCRSASITSCFSSDSFCIWRYSAFVPVRVTLKACTLGGLPAGWRRLMRLCPCCTN